MWMWIQSHVFFSITVALIVYCLLCGVVAAVIGHRKNLSVGQSFALGAFLGPYGVASVVREKRGLPKAPAGMRAVKCPRCNVRGHEKVPLVAKWRSPLVAR